MKRIQGKDTKWGNAPLSRRMVRWVCTVPLPDVAGKVHQYWMENYLVSVFPIQWTDEVVVSPSLYLLFFSMALLASVTAGGRAQ